MKRLLVLLLVVAFAVAAPARAQWVVFDPTNLAVALENLAELIEQYTQMVRTYQQIRAQYDHWVWMAQRLSPSAFARYRTLANTWRSLAAGNTYNTVDGWLGAVNTGSDALGGYRRATQRLHTYGAAAGVMPADAWARAKARYGQVELLDASTAQGLETIGQMRLRAADALRATKALEDDALSASDDLNTMVAVLNKISAAGVLSIRTSQNANQLLVSLLESQLVEATRRRDAEVAAINAHIVFQQDAQRFASQFTGGTTSAILGFRLP
jgi:Domain of unknown function (DUF4141)